MSRARLLIAALALPLLALAASTWSAARTAQASSLWVLPVEGFDPRDILRGHYIQVRYRLPADVASILVAGGWLCLTGAPEAPVIGAAARDEDSGSCAARARLLPDHDGFAAPWGSGTAAALTGRLYIPEADAALLTQLLLDRTRPASMQVRITGAGKLIPVDLLIDGKPWRTLRPAQAATAS